MTPAFKLHSPETGTEYWIYASVPADADAPLPAMLWMDGDDQFAPAVAAYAKQREHNAVAPLAHFGVGYGASYTKPGNRRGRDYTPVRHSDEPSSGGADAFLQFLTGTLWPELSRRYRLRQDVRGIGGHSLGSLLVLHALFQPQPFFSRCLASAPSIWWAERALLPQLRQFRETHPKLDAHLVLSVGEDDTASMTGDLALLEQQLASAPFAGLHVTSQRFPGRNHYNVLPDAFAAGMASLFPAR